MASAAFIIVGFLIGIFTGFVVGVAWVDCDCDEEDEDIFW